MSIKRDVVAEINLNNFEHNLDLIRHNIPAKTLMLAVLKADAYGHGALKLAEVLLKKGVEYLGVATLDEALELRARFLNARILILGYIPYSAIGQALDNDIALCVYQYEFAQALNKEASKRGKKAHIHIKLDTGMGRIGFECNTKNIQEILSIAALSFVQVDAIFTHFATADEEDKSYLHQQYKTYSNFIYELHQKGMSNFLKHCANSASIISHPYSCCDMVRAGIVLYGLKPSQNMDMKHFDFKSIMTLKTKIVHLKTLSQGQSVSYGRKYIADKKCIIATLPIGYADGYMRLLSHKAQVLIRQQRANIVGNICMDYCMVDVSHIHDVQLYDDVVLFGYDDFGNELSVDELATHIGTINYEIVCAISKRVLRVYKAPYC